MIVTVITDYDRRFLKAMHCRADEPPTAEEAYDDLANAYERIEDEAAVAHRACKRLAAQLTVWRVAAVFFFLLWVDLVWKLL